LQVFTRIHEYSPATIWAEGLHSTTQPVLERLLSGSRMVIAELGHARNSTQPKDILSARAILVANPGFGICRVMGIGCNLKSWSKHSTCLTGF